MSTDAPAFMHSPLQRSGPLPLHEQLRSSIEIAIINGELPDGAPLPSVRRLARDLSVAPSTVQRVYRDLLEAQLIEVVPQRGHFVSTGLTSDPDAPTALAVRELIDDVIEQALGHGLSLPSFLQLVVEQVRRREQALRRVAVVGYRDFGLAERVAYVAHSLSDLLVRVMGLSFEDLEARNGSAPSTNLAEVAWFLVPVGETREAATLLGPHARRVIPMTRALREDVRDFIARQPESTRFGIITGGDVLIPRVVTLIQQLHPLRVRPMITSLDHPDEVAYVLREADALILGAYAFRDLRDRLPEGKPSVNLSYLPDAATIRHLRSLILANNSPP